jgi:hypothetical protein
VVAHTLRRPQTARIPTLHAGTREEEPMLVRVSDSTVMSDKVRKMFLRHPNEEFQLLDIAGHAHISVSCHDLRDATDRLVEEGYLDEHRHGGGRYYCLHTIH